MSRPTVTTHELKTWPDCFRAVRDGGKKFEIRLNDRNFQLGDILILREFRPCPHCHGTGRERLDAWDSASCGCNETSEPRGRYTGRKYEATVTFMTELHQQEGYVVMGITERK